jgi:DNA polymerase III epsilon subunit-like protein
MTTSVFSKLCTTIKTKEPYSRCCELIIEGNQSKQVLLRAGIYSIALETLTNIIYEENKEKINPISDKKLAKLIRGKFSEVVKEYDEFISEYGMKIIESKINDINKPTNSKKLSMPFELYRIKLNKDDIEILNHRNKFLHGTSPFGEEELKEKEYEIKFIIARLHYMINSLMLKYIGYSGHIINYPAWIQFNKKEKLTDHLFRII